MVDSDKGITNLHVPSDVIIDASMPPMMRDVGRMWNADGEQQDAKAIIPDRSYAGIYDAVVEICTGHGAFDPSTMGSVPNVGLMAQKAEEYGSHDKTFEIAGDGHDAGRRRERGRPARARRREGRHLAGVPGQGRARAGLGEAGGPPRAGHGSAGGVLARYDRAHDARADQEGRPYLGDHDTDGLEIPILSPPRRMRFSLERIRRGEDTISVTGNVLRDYLTDLFPILEIGTSAPRCSRSCRS